MMIDLPWYRPHLFSIVSQCIESSDKHYARVLRKHLYHRSDVATFSVVAKRARARSAGVRFAQTGMRTNTANGSE